MSKGGGKTQKVDNAPWAGAQPHLRDIFSRAGVLSQGSGLAPQSPFTSQAQNLTAQRALGGSPLTDASQQGLLSTMRGDFLDLSKNPAAQSAMGMARSQINSQFGGDNFGNSAHQEWLGKGLMNAAAPFYESERGRQMQAFGLAPALASQDYTDLGMLGQVGAQQDARAQMQKDDPWTQLQRYQQLISSGAGGASTQSQQLSTNPLGSALGGALGGHALGGALGFAGPWGALAGAGLGLLGGL